MTNAISSSQLTNYAVFCMKSARSRCVAADLPYLLRVIQSKPSDGNKFNMLLFSVRLKDNINYLLCLVFLRDFFILFVYESTHIRDRNYFQKAHLNVIIFTNGDNNNLQHLLQPLIYVVRRVITQRKESQFIYLIYEEKLLNNKCHYQ